MPDTKTLREHAEAIVRQWDGVSVAKGTSVDHAQAILDLLDDAARYGHGSAKCILIYDPVPSYRGALIPTSLSPAEMALWRAAIDASAEMQ